VLFRSIEPERFVETKTHYSDWGTSFKRTIEQVLPDGTKHGQYFRTSLGDGRRKDTDLDYRMGKLHGKYSVEIFDDTSHEKEEGSFSDGIPVGTFSFELSSWSETPKTYFLSFEDGLPVQFWGNDKKVSLVWEKRDTVSVDGFEYTNVLLTLEHIPAVGIVYPFLGDNRIDITAHLQKISPKVYAIDRQGEPVQIFIPAFPN